VVVEGVCVAGQGLAHDFQVQQCSVFIMPLRDQFHVS